MTRVKQGVTRKSASGGLHKKLIDAEIFEEGCFQMRPNKCPSGAFQAAGANYGFQVQGSNFKVEQMK